MKGLINNISASVFSYFIDDQYHQLKNKLINEDRFIEDVFHQSLIDLFDELRFDFESTLKKTFKLFFIKYKENLSKHNQDKRQYILYDQSIIEFIISKNNLIEL